MRKHFITAMGFCLVVAMAACDSAGKKTEEVDARADSANMSDTAMATMPADTAMYNAASASISGTKADTVVTGMAKFTRKGNKTELQLTLEVPKKANSTVAVHFHEHGDCSDEGKGAHGHWNPTNEEHGKWGSGKYHSGDIGNIKLDKDGKATFTVETDRWTIGGPEKTNILNRGIIVHSGVDDYKSQPAGNSGSRIGCGVIQKM
ncbi:superoxide dismutase family protein [Mucilaginibacter auburnensis]|uniref:Superoxide dismutase [Cu-Zn] n=1 Tax=Mucilaginibacter auburnensis TaxID=1457233 RepID=A0A2H9VLP2_9SPHI|nr:superoxide dismutase family protein [Mucilaginibacter auburnensis]PJJ79215.1 Cu-Zn family superoxide dismutase [Mucilaginibacter auburnensis]